MKYKLEGLILDSGYYKDNNNNYYCAEKSIEISFKKIYACELHRGFP